MKESLEIIRSLGLPIVFEDLYWGRAVPLDLDIYMSYPAQFRDETLDDWRPLTNGRLVPLVDDGNFFNICFFDPDRTSLSSSSSRPQMSPSPDIRPGSSTLHIVSLR